MTALFLFPPAWAGEVEEGLGSLVLVLAADVEVSAASASSPALQTSAWAKRHMRVRFNLSGGQTRQEYYPSRFR